VGTTATVAGGRPRRFAELADSTAASVAIVSVTVVATVARFREYFERRSMWFDEAAVAMNIVLRSFRQLLQPLDNEQTAAPLFLWGERVAYLIGGNNEFALRALPLLAGLMLPIAMWAVARRLLPTIEAIIAVAFLSLAPLVVYYANETKPYGIDVLVTTLLFLAALRVGEMPASRRRWIELALGGAVAVGISIPAPLVLAGVAAYIVLKPEVRRAPGFLANGAIVAGVWVVAAGLALMVYRPVMSHQSYIGGFMQHFWESTFLTTEPPGLKERAGTALAGATRHTFLNGVVWPQQTNMILVIALVGLLRIVRSRGVAAAALLTVPIGLLIIASALRMYPLGERVILFASPVTALLVVAGFTWPAQLFRGAARTAAAVLAGVLLLIIPARGAFGGMPPLPGRSETRDMIHEMSRARSQSPRPVIWLSAGSVMAWRYYVGPMTQPNAERKPGVLPPQPDSIDAGVLVGKWSQSTEAKQKPDWGMFEIDRMRASGSPCGYMLLSGQLERNERAQLVSAIQRSGSRIVATRNAEGAEMLRVCFPQT
jgi:hypothetical protein